MRDFIKTSDVAAYCQVTNDAVVKWIRAGKLVAVRTPGGHYRVRTRDFRVFLSGLNWPIDEEKFSEWEAA